MNKEEKELKYLNLDLHRLSFILANILQTLDNRLNSWYLEKELNSFSRDKAIYQTCHLVLMCVLTTIKGFKKLTTFTLKHIKNDIAFYDIIVDDVKELTVEIRINLNPTCIEKEESNYTCSLNPIYTVFEQKVVDFLKELLLVLNIQKVWTMFKPCKVVILTNNTHKIRLISLALSSIQKNLSWEINDHKLENSNNPVEFRQVDKNRNLIAVNKSLIYITESSSATFRALPSSYNVSDTLSLDYIFKQCKENNDYLCYFKRLWTIKTFDKIVYFSVIVQCEFFQSHGAFENWVKVDNKVLSEYDDRDLIELWDLQQITAFVNKINFENCISKNLLFKPISMDEDRYGDEFLG